MLYLVATPIGNLEDITLRAIKTLFSVDLILCEDTRKTLLLLQHYRKNEEPIPKLLSFYEENEKLRIPEVINLLKLDKQIALVSNSGTPTISDPGFKLVRECLKENIKVISIPGPSSPISALASSGLPTDKFIFLGFTPNKQSHRIKLFNSVKEANNILSSTIIFFESPFRIIKSLADLKSVFGDIEIVIARELTKIHEEIVKEKISVLLEKFGEKSGDKSGKQIPKGEFVILLNLSTCQVV